MTPICPDCHADVGDDARCKLCEAGDIRTPAHVETRVTLRLELARRRRKSDAHFRESIRILSETRKGQVK